LGYYQSEIAVIYDNIRELLIKIASGDAANQEQENQVNHLTVAEDGAIMDYVRRPVPNHELKLNSISILSLKSEMYTLMVQ
jgi:hypothetical protein